MVIGPTSSDRTIRESKFNRTGSHVILTANQKIGQLVVRTSQKNPHFECVATLPCEISSVLKAN